jgi:hypothetical protein
MAVFWAVTSCNMADVYQRFRCDSPWRWRQQVPLKFQLNFYQITRCYNTEDSHLLTHRSPNLTSYRFSCLSNYSDKKCRMVALLWLVNYKCCRGEWSASSYGRFIPCYRTTCITIYDCAVIKLEKTLYCYLLRKLPSQLPPGLFGRVEVAVQHAALSVQKTSIAYTVITNDLLPLAYC